MNITQLKNIFRAAVIMLGAAYAHTTLAHSAGGPFDFSGTDASASDLVAVQCFNDGNGDADSLVIQIEDLSPPVPGLLVSMQVTKDNKMTNTTDTSSGDGNASPSVRLRAGGGEYRISVTKTNAGTRQINATYHCETSGNVHTGTSDLSVFQVQ